MRKKILVTGGYGFIGSHYIRYLLKTDPNVRVLNVDIGNYSANPFNLEGIEKDRRYEFIRMDLAEKEDVFALFKKKHIDEVVHFAAESHVDRSIDGSEPFIRSNILGTYRLLEAVRRFQSVQRMVHVSTDEVYGSVIQGRTREEEPLAPGNPYSASKGSSDLLCLAYSNTYGINLSITRCTNNYGPNQHPEKLIPKLILNALRDQSLPLYGNGLQERDWLHVLDHCRGVDLVRKKGKRGEVYHIGGENTVSNLEVARQILSYLGKPYSMIQHISDRPGHDFRYSLDTRKIQQELGWSPQISWEEGLGQTIRWYSRVNQQWFQSFGKERIS